MIGCAATLGLLAWHCADDPAGVSAEDLVALLKDGRTQGYVYNALDTSGTERVRGVLFVTMEDSTRLSGFWNLEATGNGQGSIGPQVGSGTLEGFLEGAEIQINLNPDYADNNIFLLRQALGFRHGIIGLLIVEKHHNRFSREKSKSFQYKILA